MNFEGWRLGITGSDLDVLKSFYRYVIVSLDFPLHTENVFKNLPSVFGWILGQEKPHFHIFVKWENLEKIVPEPPEIEPGASKIEPGDLQDTIFQRRLT